MEFFQLSLATGEARHTFGNAINKESAEVQGNPGQAQEHQKFQKIKTLDKFRKIKKSDKFRKIEIPDKFRKIKTSN